jgi:hypothetical protein
VYCGTPAIPGGTLCLRCLCVFNSRMSLRSDRTRSHVAKPLQPICRVIHAIFLPVRFCRNKPRLYVPAEVCDRSKQPKHTGRFVWQGRACSANTVVECISATMLVRTRRSAFRAEACMQGEQSRALNDRQHGSQTHMSATFRL